MSRGSVVQTIDWAEVGRRCSFDRSRAGLTRIPFTAWSRAGLSQDQLRPARRTSTTGRRCPPAGGARHDGTSFSSIWVGRQAHCSLTRNVNFRGGAAFQPRNTIRNATSVPRPQGCGELSFEANPSRQLNEGNLAFGGARVSKCVGRASTATPPDRALLNPHHKSKNRLVRETASPR